MENQEQNLGHIIEPLRNLAIPIDELNPDPNNARLHPIRNIEAIKASFNKFGQRIPIVVQKQGMIVRAGNARLEAARSLGWTHVAAIVVDETDLDAIAFGIADNRAAELAEWDRDVLANLLAELQADDSFDQLVTGFNDVEINKLLSFINENIEALELPAQYYVTIEVDSEERQKQLFDEMTERGLKCRLVIF
jgi:ParB family chromosome partitioning protein